jgi:hypothetical protein
MLERPVAATTPRHGPGPREFLYLAALSVLWGSSFMLTKIALESLSATTVVAGRIAIACVVLVAVLAAHGQRLPRDPWTWLWFALLGTAGGARPGGRSRRPRGHRGTGRAGGARRARRKSLGPALDRRRRAQLWPQQRVRATHGPPLAGGHRDRGDDLLDRHGRARGADRRRRPVSASSCSTA